MPESELAKELRQKAQTKHARRAVSRKLALYHKSLIDAFSADAASFFDRVMEKADENIQSRRDLLPPQQS
jgi:hypothetical protein